MGSLSERASRMRVAASVCAAGCIVGVGAWVNAVVSRPYMDELFHVAQTQRYCRGEYETWDPMITTLPGTYLHGVAWSKLLGVVAGDRACSVASLRALNWVFGALLVVVCYKLCGALHKSHDTSLRIAHTAAVVLSPPLFFTVFLYYTDVIATFYAVLCYYLALVGVPTPGHAPRAPSLCTLVASALAGAVAVVCRQTNIVWVAYAAATAATRILGQRKASYDDYVDQFTASGYSLVFLPFPSVALHSAAALRAVVRYLWPFVMVGAGFGVFLLVNGGIVVGDRSSHAAVLNAGQLGYMLLWTALPLVPGVLDLATWRRGIDDRLPSWRSIAAAVGALAVACVAAAWALRHYSPVHLYTLSDNRHFTFYIWNRFLARGDAFRMGMALPYVLSGALITHRLWRSVGVTGSLLWLAAGAAVTLPAGLFEFRYYILPAVMAHVHVSHVSKWAAAVAAGGYALVNAATLALFLLRPFDGEQRFMW